MAVPTDFPPVVYVPCVESVATPYEDGLGSVGDAIGDGAAAVADTGSAIGELATGAWDAIF
ncbi:hypothetical protein [Rhodococcus sp. IEGM 1330]|uniref:hypothetical protein n=1 Tax=Rhodococcus sp. IEGM 1330 TaxID=3082225 RepID=UPI002954B8CC|nr:hypothetical protein [Rhodococcus sp. IEGM 1330]MDV8023778.1 hypothetical protein [Rhodococcus sp. IEGM 1330]